MSSTEAAARGTYEISTDPARLDVAAIHAYLTRSYWSPGIPIGIVERALRHSLCFGIYECAGGAQVGLARVVTDYATFAYLCDVYVLEEHRGFGLGKRMMRELMAHPALRGVVLAHLSETNNTPLLALQRTRDALRRVGWRSDNLWAATQSVPCGPVGADGARHSMQMSHRATQLALEF